MKLIILSLLFLIPIQTQHVEYKKTIISGQRALVSPKDTVFIYNDNEAWGRDSVVRNFMITDTIQK